jgi:hypothetical protein
MQKGDCFESLHRNSSVLSVSSVVILGPGFHQFCFLFGGSPVV